MDHAELDHQLAEIQARLKSVEGWLELSAELLPSRRAEEGRAPASDAEAPSAERAA